MMLVKKVQLKIASITGFAHEKKQGLNDQNMYLSKEKTTMITKTTKSFIPYKSFKSYFDGGPGRIKTESLASHGFLWEKE